MAIQQSHAESDLRAHQRQVDRSELLSDRIAVEVSRRQHDLGYRQFAFGDLMQSECDDWLQAWDGIFGSEIEARRAKIAMDSLIDRQIESNVEKEYAGKGA